MFGWRSSNLEIIPLDLELERTARRNLRTPPELETVKMGDQCDNIHKNVGIVHIHCNKLSLVHSVAPNQCHPL
jgi:hypothetical protein